MVQTYCEYCGQPLNKRGNKYCSSKCSEAKKHDAAYKDFLENNEKYCRGNYTPKNFKKDFFKKGKYKLEKKELDKLIKVVNEKTNLLKQENTKYDENIEFLNEQNGVCAICGCEPFHNGKSLTFILDHIDGDASNNKRDNLRLICPNCDSQLETFKSKNKNSTRRNYWKEKILNEFNNN